MSWVPAKKHQLLSHGYVVSLPSIILTLNKIYSNQSTYRNKRLCLYNSKINTRLSSYLCMLNTKQKPSQFKIVKAQTQVIWHKAPSQCTKCQHALYNTINNICHKLYLAISPQILAQFPWSKMSLKALRNTFQTMPKTWQSNQYSSGYQLISAGHWLVDILGTAKHEYLLPCAHGSSL